MLFRSTQGPASMSMSPGIEGKHPQCITSRFVHNYCTSISELISTRVSKICMHPSNSDKTCRNQSVTLTLLYCNIQSQRTYRKPKRVLTGDFVHGCGLDGKPNLARVGNPALYCMYMPVMDVCKLISMDLTQYGWLLHERAIYLSCNRLLWYCLGM